MVLWYMGEGESKSRNPGFGREMRGFGEGGCSCGGGHHC